MKDNQNNAELELLEGIINSLDKICDIAFSIPAPNVYTPRIAEQIFFLLPIIKKAIFTARTPSPYQSIAEEMAEATQRYFDGYMQDEADDEENCICGEEQHQAAVAVKQALTKFNQLKEKKDA